MLEALVSDIGLVRQELDKDRVLAGLIAYGSTVNSNESPHDVDIAVIVRDLKESAVAGRICTLARDAKRQLNWKISHFELNDKSFGYNTKAPLGYVHFFVINEKHLSEEYPLCKKILRGKALI